MAPIIIGATIRRLAARFFLRSCHLDIKSEVELSAGGARRGAFSLVATAPSTSGCMMNEISTKELLIKQPRVRRERDEAPFLSLFIPGGKNKGREGSSE